MLHSLHAIFVAVIIGVFLFFQIKNIVDAIKSRNRVWLWNSLIIVILGIAFFLFYIFK